jgi:hypothetical protein
MFGRMMIACATSSPRGGHPALGGIGVMNIMLVAVKERRAISKSAKRSAHDPEHPAAVLHGRVLPDAAQRRRRNAVGTGCAAGQLLPMPPRFEGMFPRGKPPLARWSHL